MDGALDIFSLRQTKVKLLSITGTIRGSLSKHVVDITEVIREKLTSPFCNHFSIMLANGVLTVLELNWYQQFGDQGYKVCKTTVFHSQICKSVTFLSSS